MIGRTRSVGSLTPRRSSERQKQNDSERIREGKSSRETNAIGRHAFPLFLKVKDMFLFLGHFIPPFRKLSTPPLKIAYNNTKPGSCQGENNA